jgi:hypothetical protein
MFLPPHLWAQGFKRLITSRYKHTRQPLWSSGYRTEMCCVFVRYELNIYIYIYILCRRK